MAITTTYQPTKVVTTYFLRVPRCGLPSWKYMEKTSEEKTIYKIIYSGFSEVLIN